MKEQSEIFELTLKMTQEQNVLACRNNKLHAVGSERTITFFFLLLDLQTFCYYLGEIPPDFQNCNEET